MNRDIKIISILVAFFISIVAIIIIVSTGFANDTLEKRIQNQFLGEASNRGNMISSLLYTYNDQVSYLIHQISEDENITMVLDELYAYLENEDLEPTYNNLKNANSINITKFVSDKESFFSILQHKKANYNNLFKNSANIETIRIFDKNGLVLLSTNPFEIGKLLYNDRNTLKQIQDITKNTIIKFGSKPDTNGDNYKQIIRFVSPFPPVELQEDADLISASNSVLLKKDKGSNEVSMLGINKENDGEYEYHISTEISTDSFNKILTNRNGLGKTGEVYLVNKSNMMISESRFINDTYPILVNTQPVRECFYDSGKNMTGIYNDYRAIPIVGFSYCAKDLGFVLLSEIDESEIYQPVWELRNKMVEISSSGVFILLIIAIIIVSLFISWNKNLKKAVAKSTFKLKETNFYLQNANAQLKEKDEIQRQFMNVAAHELRTPTQAIIGYVEMLQQSLESVDCGNSKAFSKIRSYLHTLERNSNRLLKLVSDITDITKIESGQLHLNKKKTNLNEKVVEVIKNIMLTNVEVKENKLLFVFNGEVVKREGSTLLKDPVFIHVDPERIYQVLFNLLSNAVKFSNKNGKITVILEKSNEDAGDTDFGKRIGNEIINYRLGNKRKANRDKNNNIKKNGKNQVIIRIQNQGKGIDPSVKERLFDKFVTSSEKGMGLGLYISKNIIESHGGRIWIEDEEEEEGKDKIEKGDVSEQKSEGTRKFLYRLHGDSENKNLNSDSYHISISLSLPVN